MKKTKILPILIYLGILLMILSWIMNVFGVGNSNLPYSKIVEMFRNEQVKSFVVEDHTIELKLTAPYNGKTTVTAPLADPEGFRQELGALFEEQVAAGVLESYDFLPAGTKTAYDLILPLLIVGIVLLMLWAMLMGKLNPSWAARVRILPMPMVCTIPTTIPRLATCCVSPKRLWRTL